MLKRNKINFTAPQDRSSVQPTPPQDDEQKPLHWLRMAGAVLIGLMTIVGVVFAFMQVQNWKF